MLHSMWLKTIFCVALWLLSSIAHSASVDTIRTYSSSMRKEIKSVVILPDTYLTNSKRFPVVYLLHGYGGDYSSWLSIAPHIKQAADRYQFIIICADGGYGSWYLNSPIDSSIRYETYITHELIPDIDRRYRTIANKSDRAISGLSMGGHGALFLSIKHPDLFGAAGSTSGGVDLKQFTSSWGLKEKILGDTICCLQNWINNSVINLTDKLRGGELKLLIDCGTEDFFIGVNRALHQKLLVQKIEHTYSEFSGKHNREYWKKSIDNHLLFFHQYFEEK